MSKLQGLSCPKRTSNRPEWMTSVPQIYRYIPVNNVIRSTGFSGYIKCLFSVSFFLCVCVCVRESFICSLSI